MTRLIDYAERVFLCLLCASFFYSFFIWLPTHSYAFALVVSEGLAVFFILIRKPGNMPVSAYALIIAMLGTALPLLARPGGAVLMPPLVSSGLMIVGMVINISAKLALNRSFGLVAANRGIKRGGPYRFVRHPMYLGYMTTQFGFLLGSWSWSLFAIYCIAWPCQILRIVEEEKLLQRDPEYRMFASQVPRRLLPGF
jgi:protein-S-isoprenylcysteine O-methyltransferase Ste14